MACEACGGADTTCADCSNKLIIEACGVIRGLLAAAAYGNDSYGKGPWAAIARADEFLKRAEGEK